MIKNKELVQNLKDEFNSFPKFDSKNYPDAAQHWLKTMESLKIQVEKSDAARFLEWSAINGTMFVGNAPFIDIEHSFIKDIRSEHTDWKTATRENPIGSPVPYDKDGSTSGNVIHNAYHMAMFEHYTGASVNRDIKTIFEFGGGYGSMCRVLYQSGYKGRYVMFDLPPLAAVQKYYLKSIGMNVVTPDEFNKSPNGICILSNIEELIKFINLNLKTEESMFLSTWALSETPIPIRGIITPLVEGFKYILIATQSDFEDVNNCGYFDNYVKEHTSYKWDKVEIEHIPGSKYYMGVIND